MNCKILAVGAAGALVLVAACGTFDRPEPIDNKAAIAARQAAMKAIGAASAPLRAPSVDRATAQAAGQTIHDNLRIFAANLPKGSGPEAGVPTKAKSEIWTSSEPFNNALNSGLRASELLAKSPAEGDALRAQVGSVMQSCAGCHTNYRS